VVKKIRRQDEGEGATDEARGLLEEAADAPSNNEELGGRPDRERRRAVDEKKAASPGPSVT
jgi:hypothetical protein